VKIGADMDAKIMTGISLQRQHAFAETMRDMKVNLIALDTVPGAKINRKTGGGLRVTRA